mgnify:CR=1 FL=1
MTTISIDTLKSIKNSGKKFAAVTAYDYSFATLIDKAEIRLKQCNANLGDNPNQFLFVQRQTLPKRKGR